MGIEAALIASAVLGVLHGINPSSGWLLGAYPALIGGRWLQIPRSTVMILAGHLASSSAFIALITLIAGSTRVYSSVPIFIGALLILAGLYRLSSAKRHPHRYIGLKIGAKALVAWGLASGAQHGSLLLAAPAVIVCGAHQGLHPHVGQFSNPCLGGQLAIDLIGVLGAHHLSMFVSMVIMGSAVYVLGARLLRSLWVNYEAALDLILVILGGSLVVASVFGL